jgi:hypothetical protein
MLSQRIQTSALLAIAGSGLLPLCGIVCGDSMAIAQIAIGQPTGNDTPLSLQTLGEMRQNNASILGGGMNFFQIGGDKVTVPAMEGINSLLNWQTPPENANPSISFSQTVEEFKLQQRQKIGSSNPILYPLVQISDQASAKQIRQK